MKKTILLFVIPVVLIILSIIAYRVNKNENVTTKITSVIIRNPTITASNIKIGTEAIGRFIIVNNGENTLKIKQVVPDCGCTLSEYTKDIVPPRDSTVISLQYDSNIPGPFQTSATVHMNTKEGQGLLVYRGIVD